MAFNFPDSPVNGQTYSANNVSFTYDAVADVWTLNTPGSTTASPTSLQFRTDLSISSSSLASDGSQSLNITNGFKSYFLLNVQVSCACWIRIYSNNAARSADVSRTITEDPSTASGLITELISSEAKTFSITPGIFGFNDDTSPTETIYLYVTNLEDTSQTVDITLTVVQAEA